MHSRLSKIFANNCTRIDKGVINSCYAYKIGTYIRQNIYKMISDISRDIFNALEKNNIFEVAMDIFICIYYSVHENTPIIIKLCFNDQVF